MRDKYLIKAGKNRYGRQLYLHIYEENDWAISGVPMELSKTKVTYVFPKIEKSFRNNPPIRYNKNTQFEIAQI